jgi:hypothetical protein
MLKLKRKILIVILVWASLSLGTWLKAYATDSIADNNTNLQFTSTVINMDNVTSVATGSPMYTITVNDNNGWNVTLICSSFIIGGHTITTDNLYFTATGGTVTRTSGQAIDATNGPKETSLSGPLNVALKCLTCNSSYGNGKYTWQPFSSNFVFTVSPDMYIGNNYAATLTATIAAGP